MVTKLLEALDDVIREINARLPSNLNNPKNERHTRSMEQELQKYFRSLETALPMDKLKKIYDRYVEPD